MAKKYMIKVEANPAFCGIDAGGVQFANGQAVIDECPLVEWFRTHDGYAVEEVVEDDAAEDDAAEDDAAEKAPEKATAKKAAAKKSAE